MSEEKTNNKKKYGWLVLFTLTTWSTIGLIVWKVDPTLVKDFLIPGIYLPMLLLIFLGVFFVLSILFLSAKVALRWTLGIVLFLLLRILGLGNMLNGAMILGILVVYEIYRKV